MTVYIEDSLNARRNTVTVIGNCGPAYNAVLSTSFSEEGDEPVTLQEAKDWCRIDVTDDDTLITSLITAARIICENYANLSFIERTVTAKIKNGLGGIQLPYGPVTSEIAFYDEDDTELTDYLLKNGDGNEVTAVYSAGYDEENPLPGNLKTAILNQIAWMYENRGDAKIASSLTEAAKLILNQVRSV